MAILYAAASSVAAADRIEFLSGVKIEGQVVGIHKREKTIEFESQLGGRTRKSVYPYAKIHAVTMRGKRYVFNKLATTEGQKNGGGRPHRTPAQVREWIKTVGATRPEWYDATPLEYPQNTRPFLAAKAASGVE